MGRGKDGGPLVKVLKCHTKHWNFILLARSDQRILFKGIMIKYFREIIFVALGDG